MIRSAIVEDTAALVSITVASGLFAEEHARVIREMLETYFSGPPGENHWLTCLAEGSPIGVAYYAPERMTSGTWNVLLIAIHPAYQGQGHGAALLRDIERRLTALGERVLLVETSGLPEFAPVRAFYTRCGFEEEGRIREFYKAGEDKVIFRKMLNSPST